ncbi:MAG: endopeptidase La [Clostridia bacterium]|nr:endopeptidase La [Clostridia bacterium]
MREESLRLMPAVALRGLVVFPGMFLHFDVGREKSINALKKAMDTDQEIFLVTQKDISVDDPDFSQLYEIGVVASVKQVLKLPGKSGNVRVAVEGLYRARLVEGMMAKNNSHLKAMIYPVKEPSIRADKEDYAKALVRHAKDVFAEYSEFAPQMPSDLVTSVMQEDNCGALADYIAGNIMLEYADRQRILDILNPVKRLEELCVLLANEGNLLSIEAEIGDKVQEAIDKNQREYYLREQMKIISAELGGGVSQEEELSEFREKIFYLKASDDVKEKLFKECDKLEKYSPSSPEAAVSRNYIEACLELPWGVFSKENSDIRKSEKILNDDHYGLDKVKQRILEYLAVRALAPDIKGQIICLSGPPGVGKTSIARSLAKATGRSYARISLGGVKDEAEIRGHRKTYIGSMPGRIINALKQAGTSNPLILLDEIDKLSSDYKGDPTSALLEVLDPEQNNSFRDHYIELPYDLSKVMFITTANVRSNIPEPLQDRMEIIELGSYTFEEKFNIAKKHLVPKQIKRHGMTSKQLKITDKALRLIIEGYTREAGVRALEQQIAAVCRKAAMQIISDGTEKISVKPENVEELIGSRKFRNDTLIKENEVGVVNGLAWTAVGGDMLEVEAAVLDGSGKLELTGSLGDVMQESAKAAVSYIRSKSDKLPISTSFYKDKDIHIHVPEGATPKDGPSAGVTIATALVSALSNRKVRKDVAMTGEITLRGRVLPIGGLKEKSMAAYRAGITTVIIPYDNIPDLDEVDPKVKEAITFLPVKTVSAVWDAALENNQEERGEKSVFAVTDNSGKRPSITQ